MVQRPGQSVTHEMAQAARTPPTRWSGFWAELAARFASLDYSLSASRTRNPSNDMDAIQVTN
jgi:hypothetical protein